MTRVNITMAAQFFNNRCNPVGNYIVNVHQGTFPDKGPGNRPTDTVARSGYQNFFFLKSHQWLSLLSFAQRLTCTGGRRSIQGKASSKAPATCSSNASSPNPAMNCTPMGNPSAL